MRPQESSSNLASSEHRWFSSSLGQYLCQQEQVLFDAAVVDLFGFNAVQMGCLNMNLLRNSRIGHRYHATCSVLLDQQPHLLCEDDFLPFADMSLDLLLLPHRLEFSERPHQTLREAERVLMPEGHVLISGFNPYSLWGVVYRVKKWLSPKSSAPEFPWCGHFIGLNRLKDWLALLGFEVVEVTKCCHIPPFEQTSWHSRLRILDKLGPKWLRFSAGVYFVVAKKRVAGMTPLKPSWKKSVIVPNLVVRPTQRKPSQSGRLHPHKKKCER